MKILVIDDHPLIQEALRHVLTELDAALDLVQAEDASDAHAALAAAPDTELIVLDLTLPRSDGFELLSELRRDWPGIPLLVLSATHDRATVERALDLGAMGFIPKTANPAMLLGALRQAVEGMHAICVEEGDAPCGDGVQIGPRALGLTPRQADVLKLLVEGKPNKLICRDLRLSEGTVKVHVSAILRALNVHSRSQAIIELARRGIGVDQSSTNS